MPTADYSTKTAATYRKQRNKVLKLLGGKCKVCGFNDPRALQIDHVNGGGCKTPFRNYRLAPQIIKAAPELYQLLCANCNWIKRAERNEHSSQTPASPLIVFGVCTRCGLRVDDSVRQHLSSLYHIYAPALKPLLASQKFTHAQIGRWFGVSRERIRQIAAIIKKLDIS